MRRRQKSCTSHVHLSASVTLPPIKQRDDPEHRHGPAGSALGGIPFPTGPPAHRRQDVPPSDERGGADRPPRLPVLDPAGSFSHLEPDPDGPEVSVRAADLGRPPTVVPGLNQGPPP